MRMSHITSTPPPESSSNQFQECSRIKSIPSGVGGDPETSLQEPLSNSIANFELTHYSRNDQQLPSANLWRRRFSSHTSLKETIFRSSRSVGCFLSLVTRDLVPKWRTYCFQFFIHAEIIGLNKDMTSYKSTCFFAFLLFFPGEFLLRCTLHVH